MLSPLSAVFLPDTPVPPPAEKVGGWSWERVPMPGGGVANVVIMTDVNRPGLAIPFANFDRLDAGQKAEIRELIAEDGYELVEA
jgi:hypothetical protein